MTFAANRLIAVASFAFCLLLVACSGTGSQTPTSSLPPPSSPSQSSLPPYPTPPIGLGVSSYEGRIHYTEYASRRDQLAEWYRTHANFQNQYGLDMINAEVAYANLDIRRSPSEANSPGKGVRIGIVDSGIDQNSPAFDRRLISESFVPGAVDESSQTWEVGFDTFNSHGTPVASVIASRKGSDIWTDKEVQDKHFHGVSWGASIEMISRFSALDGSSNPITLAQLKEKDSSQSALFRLALSKNVDFMNLSYSYDGVISYYTEQQLRENFSKSIAELAQSGSSDKTILVWAAGNGANDGCPSIPDYCDAIDNDNGSSPKILPGLMALIPELRGHSIAAVAVGRDGEITDFSNRCGIAADWCIAAPGEDISVLVHEAIFDHMKGTIDRSRSNRGIRIDKGTSYAAPFVVGGLAVMKHVFRSQLSNTQLVSRLFHTANKKGIYQDESTYGQGLMDLGAATSIYGNPVVPSSGSVNGGGSSLTSTGMQLGLAFGDSLHTSLGAKEFVALDQLKAPFWFELNDFMSPASPDSLSGIVRESLYENKVRSSSAGGGVQPGNSHRPLRV